jgi:tetratricopeptide (TPR) repeat protein
MLTILVIGGLYVIREQLAGASWARPFDATPTPARTSESYFDEAEVLYQDGLLDEAIVAYQSAFRADPEDNIALFRLVRLLTIRQRTAEVLDQFGARLQDEDLGAARTLAVLGMALDWHADSNTEDLLPAYIELGVVSDEDVQAEDWEYSRERMARQLVRTAHKMCEQALRLDSDLPEGYAYIAETLADRERFDEALAAAQTAVELNPNLPDTQRALAYVHVAQGEYELAVQAYENAINAHPRLSFLHVDIGKNYRAIGYGLDFEGKEDEAKLHFDQAIASFEEAIRLDPANPQSYDEIGWTFGHYMGYLGDDREMMQRGVDYLEDAIDRNPEYALAYRHLGQVFYFLRNYEEAIPAFEQGLELGGLPPADAIQSHIMLGWSYYILDLDDEDIEDSCVRAVEHFRAAWDALDELPQRELDLEGMARQGLDACK